MKYFIRGLRPVIYILIVEILIYIILFRNIEVATYAFLWAGIIIGALLLKLTNANPVDNPLDVTRAEEYTNMSKIKALFHQNRVTLKYQHWTVLL